MLLPKVNLYINLNFTVLVRFFCSKGKAVNMRTGSAYALSKCASLEAWVQIQRTPINTWFTSKVFIWLITVNFLWHFNLWNFLLVGLIFAAWQQKNFLSYNFCVCTFWFLVVCQPVHKHENDRNNTWQEGGPTSFCCVLKIAASAVLNI